jgi:hypothetical protein
MELSKIAILAKIASNTCTFKKSNYFRTIPEMRCF